MICVRQLVMMTARSISTHYTRQKVDRCFISAQGFGEGGRCPHTFGHPQDLFVHLFFRFITKKEENAEIRDAGGVLKRTFNK